MNIRNFVVPTILENTDENFQTGNEEFRTKDLVYLDDFESVKGFDREERVAYPTDYAVMCGAMLSSNYMKPENKNSCCTCLRSSSKQDYVDIVELHGITTSGPVYETTGTLRPVTQLDLSAVIAAQGKSPDIFNISEYKVNGKVKYHTIEFGEYPKTYVGADVHLSLDKSLSEGKLTATGKKYSGHWDFNADRLVLNDEYILNNKRYVRVVTQGYDKSGVFTYGTHAPQSGTQLWVKVEPITWIIKNWDDMPQQINPNGTGKATTMEIQTKEGIIAGIPFYSSYHNNYNMWQNSIFRFCLIC